MMSATRVEEYGGRRRRSGTSSSSHTFTYEGSSEATRRSGRSIRRLQFVILLIILFLLAVSLSVTRLTAVVAFAAELDAALRCEGNTLIRAMRSA
jgi:hypothetical protein